MNIIQLFTLVYLVYSNLLPSFSFSRIYSSNDFFICIYDFRLQGELQKKNSTKLAKYAMNVDTSIQTVIFLTNWYLKHEQLYLPSLFKNYQYIALMLLYVYIRMKFILLSNRLHQNRLNLPIENPCIFHVPNTQTTAATETVSEKVSF